MKFASISQWVLVAGLVAILALTFVAEIPAAGVWVDNMALLSAAKVTADHDALLLSEILAFIEILDSANLGVKFVVSADIDVGHVFAGIKVFADRALMIAFVAATFAEMWNLVALACGWVEIPLLRGLLICAILWQTTCALRADPHTQDLFEWVFRFGMALFMCVWLFIPYSISVVGLVAQLGADHGVETHQETVSTLHQDIVSDPAKAAPLEFWKSEQNIHQQFVQTHNDVDHKTAHLGKYAVARLVHAIGLGLVFPIALSLLMWCVFNRLQNHCLGKFKRSLKSRSFP
jgi:hypothetical protein